MQIPTELKISQEWRNVPVKQKTKLGKILQPLFEHQIITWPGIRWYESARLQGMILSIDIVLVPNAITNKTDCNLHVKKWITLISPECADYQRFDKIKVGDVQTDVWSSLVNPWPGVQEPYKIVANPW